MIAPSLRRALAPGRGARPAGAAGVRRLAASTALLLLFGGCGDAEGSGTGSAAAVLRGKALTDTLALMLPVGIVLLDDRVVVQDAYGASTVRVFSGDGGLIASNGRRGAGPGEFVDPVDAFARAGRPGEFWVFDARGARLTPFTLAPQDGRVRLERASDPVRLDPGLVVEAPRWLDDSTLVALDPMLAPGDRRFALFGVDGVRRRSVGEPPPGSTKIRPFIRQQAYGGKLAVHPREPLFVLASRFAGRMEVFGSDGVLRTRLAVPDAFEPDFTPAPDGVNMKRGHEFRDGYVDVAVSPDRIYGLFSGLPDRKDGANYGRAVHVFDWSGRLLGVLPLDGPAFRIAVDGMDRQLYALRHDPQPQLVRYDLPDLLHATAGSAR